MMPMDQRYKNMIPMDQGHDTYGSKVHMVWMKGTKA